MSKLSHAIARKKTIEFLDRAEIENHMFYGPTSDAYWAEDFKAVIVNMEPWGYDGRYNVDEDTLWTWLDACDSKKTATTKYSLALLCVLLESIRTNATADKTQFYEAYRDKDLLGATIDRTVYFNIKSESNRTRHQDFDGIVDSGKGDLGQLIWQEIIALDPNVVIVTGEATVHAINHILGGKSSLKYKGRYLTDEGFSIHSIRHASLPCYQKWADTVNQILAEQAAASDR